VILNLLKKNNDEVSIGFTNCFNGLVIYDKDTKSLIFNFSPAVKFGFTGISRYGDARKNVVSSHNSLFDTYIKFKKISARFLPKTKKKMAIQWCAGVKKSFVKDCIRDVRRSGLNFGPSYRREK